MKKIVLVMGIIMAVWITGCSGTQANVGEPTQDAPDSGSTTDPNSATVQEMQNPAEITQLLFGTLLLENSDLAVTADQAVELLPLWKVYRSLLDSDITAAEELEAVAKQITRKMTAEQLATMEGQTLDREQMSATMEELGIDFAGAGRGDGFEQPDGFTPPDGFAPPDGFRPGQGEGPGGGPGGAGIDPEIMATRQAELEANGGFQRGFNLPLVEALIELLEQRAG